MRTARLELRRPRPEDVPTILAITGDPRTTVHNPGDAIRDLDGATELYVRWNDHWNRHGFGYSVAVLITDPAVTVGFAGVKHVELQGLPVLNLFYRLHPDFWGSGYATEAAAAVVDVAAREHPTARLVARVRPRNLASRRIVQKLGLVPAGGIVGEDGYEDLFERPPQLPAAGPVRPNQE